ncbi:porin [Qipengyuania marisflavi]|uniref:Porin n=1 Tax=Qipengyuania marisflavi TaxID=2486356 RepID=A0A5S3P8F0_9SPHN|nr:porin [Qipengyuania marisflavi]TMM49782.1 hypothetical protein FEV51_00850 [Qipengyuania marisflavi]
MSLLRLSVMAAALSCTVATPLYAQDTASELAAMRAQLDAMNTRINQLEGELQQANQQIESQATIVAALPAAAEPDTKISWKGAPVIEGKGGWSFKPRGRLQFDAGITNAPDSTGREDGFGNEVRRARLGVQGDIPGGFGYKFEVDIAGNDVEVADGFLSYEDGGLTATVGHHNNFQGLEELTSSLNTSMIERAAFTDAFGFERRVGASLQYGTGDVLVQGGVFTDNIGDLSNKNWSADGRVVAMPKMGGTQLHLGGSIHYTDLEDGSTVRYRQRPLVHFTSNRFIDTASLGASSEFGLGLEAAAISGPFHVTGEAFWQQLNRPGALSDPTFFGGYAEVGYFLTSGDKRGYKKGTFDRIKPKNAVGEGGIGAIQVNLRYDYLDLNDSGIVGGIQNGFGASLVWTPTDYTRFLLNYGKMVYDDAVYPTANGDRSYSVDAFAVRAQVDF